MKRQSQQLPARLSGSEVRRLMRENGRTIQDLARRMCVTQDEVRRVRDCGVPGALEAAGWWQAITGHDVFEALRQACEDRVREFDRRLGKGT